MSLKTNNAFPELKQLAAFQIIKNFDRYSFHETDKCPDPVLRCIKGTWDSLKEGGSQAFGPNHIMQNIEKSLVEDFCKKCHVLSTDLPPDQKETLLIYHVQGLFRKLAQELGISIGLHSWPTVQKKWEEEAFIPLWTASIRPELKKNAPQLFNEEEIKLWMEVPDNAKHLNQITSVILSKYQLQAIPLEIKNLMSLTDLDLDDNKIKYIPEFICTLPNLEVLSLENNKISCIPNAIGSCKNLKDLFLDNNQITHIPDAMAGLTKLEALTLNNNKISCISGSLSSLTKLHLLDLTGNPLPLHLQGPEQKGLLIVTSYKIKSFLAKEKALKEYKCTGCLSQFIQLTQYALSIDRHDIIKEAYHKHLSDRDKELICMALFEIKDGEKYSDELWEDDQFLFKNIEAFCNAAITAITLKYGLLSPDHRSLIRDELSAQEQNSLFDNVLLLSDIMEEVEINSGLYPR